MTRTDYNERTLRRRMEVLRLPVTDLTVHGYLKPSYEFSEWEREPCAVGIGPDHVALAVWASRDRTDRMLVTRHDGGKQVVSATMVVGAVRPWFVQPLPGDRLLLTRARSRRGAGDGAQVWSADGQLLTTGDLGGAIGHMLTTSGGAVWVGYFDEAMSGSGPQVHGLARFTADLSVDWLYPQQPPLPTIFDCYALNVFDETAVTCAYTEFHVLSVSGFHVTDRGDSPHRGGHNLLVDGHDGVFVGGYGAEYDLVTPIRLGPDGIAMVGEQHRLVLPDGMEIRSARYTCRGGELHAIIGTTWYRTTIDRLCPATPLS